MIESRRLRWTGHLARMEEGRSTFKILTGKPTGKRPLKPYLKETSINRWNWIDSAQDRDYWRALVNIGISGETL